MKIIGKAFFKDYDGFIKYIQTEEGKEWYDNLWTTEKERNYAHHVIEIAKGIYLINARDNVVNRDYRGYRINTTIYDNEMKYEERFHKGFDILYIDKEKGFAVINYGDVHNAGLVPLQFLEINEFKDYSEFTTTEMNAIKGESHALMPSGALSIKGVEEEKEDKEEQIDKIKKEIEDVSACKDGELAELKAQIEAMQEELNKKKDAIIKELQEKKRALNVKVADLNKTVYQLETEIHAIQCFEGETVDFIQLRDGKPADEEVPVTLFQRLRYMDKELAKKMALLDVDFSDHELFEDFLTHSPEAEELFYPTEKCIMAVKACENNVSLIKACNKNGEPINMLECYEKYHGNKTGLIVRDGEKLFIGWIDDEIVTIKKDIFNSDKDTEMNAEDMEEMAKKLELEKESRIIDAEYHGRYTPSEDQKEFISRYLFFNILQGLVKRNIINLPEGTSLVEENDYVIYSKADNWVKAKPKWGSFDEILQKYHREEKVGDIILTMTSLHDTSYYSDYWSRDKRGFSNDDSYGYNRARGASAEDRTIYKINKVAVSNESDKREVYIAVKRDTYTYNESLTCNFRLYNTEYINITFLNSVFINNILTYEDFGGWNVKGHIIPYTYGASYLWKAKEFLAERENEVIATGKKLGADMNKLPDEWQVAMSDWMLANDVRRMTEHQVKRFLKHLNLL